MGGETAADSGEKVGMIMQKAVGAIEFIEVYDNNFPSSPLAKYFTKFMIRSRSYQNLFPPLFLDIFIIF